MKKILFLLIALGFLINVVPLAMAHCPLCTAATGAAVLGTRSAGLSDSIVGVFIGGFVLSTALWFDRVLKKKKKELLPFQSAIFIIISLILTVISFKFSNLSSGFDKLNIGIFAGTAISWTAFAASNKVKEKRGKVLFKFQTIILTFAALAITATVLQLVLK